MAKINFLYPPSGKPTPSAEKGTVMTVVANLFTPTRAELFKQTLGAEMESLEEIRIRRGQVVLGRGRQREYPVPPEVDKAEMEYILQRLNQSSLYAWEEEYRRGYLTLTGGHRVGLAGKTMLEHGEVRALKDINALNIRLARNVYGAADKILPFVLNEGRVRNTLLLGPPGSGKTTVLRELIRTLSDEAGCQVAVVDERSELAGMYEGQSCLDIGQRVDVLDGCPKAAGMNMLIRAMAPEVLATDELGQKEDIAALEEALASGVALLTTVHGRGLEDLRQRPALAGILQKHLFEVIVVLGRSRGAGTVESVYQWQSEGYERVRADEMAGRFNDNRRFGDERLALCRTLQPQDQGIGGLAAGAVLVRDGDKL